MLMNRQVAIESCRKNGGYAQPHLNDQLYLHCRGFCNIAGLEDFVNLKVLWLEQNAITHIEGLEKLTNLVTLFLHNNAIREIGTGLSSLQRLRTLNLSHNSITKIENLSSLPLLETLQLSHNRLGSLRDCEHVRLCPNLSCLDISFNRIEKEEGNDDMTLVNFFAPMADRVSVLYLHGNDLPRGTKNYRKNMVFHLKQLTYLDEMPVFPDERRTTEAWGAGGPDAEKAERQRIFDEKQEQLTRVNQVTRQMWEANREERERRTREWDEKQKKERAEQTVRYQGYAIEQDSLMDEETQVRWERIAEEGKELAAWLRHEEADRELAAANFELRLEREAAEAEEAARVKQAEAELQEEERQRSQVAKAKAREDHAERQFWIDRFIEEDAKEEKFLAENIETLLSQLIPGAAPLADAELNRRLAPLPAPTRTSKRALIGQVLSTAGGVAAPTATASAQQNIAAKVAQKVFKSVPRSAAVVETWEKYYEFEQATKNRRW